MLAAALLPALAGYHLGARRPSARLARCAGARCADASTAIQYGGIPHVAVIVAAAEDQEAEREPCNERCDALPRPPYRSRCSSCAVLLR